MRKYILSFALLFVLAALYAGAARAQVGEQLRETRQEFKQFRQAEVQEFKQRLEQLKAANQTKREEFKATVEQNRSELRTRVQTEREQLKEKLAAIKDERKKQIVERVAQQLNELNERQTNHLVQVLDKLDTALGRVGTRTDKAEANGRDISSVRTAISAANEAITASRAAISVQAGKSYTIAVTDEAGLRKVVGDARQTLHNDLSETRKAVKTAHDAVKKAATTLAQIPQVDELKVEPSATE
ncbi:MAG: hypothetical protein UX53_C0004G0030 [Candidatus Azambacteria bacterium GW2011_GWB2_46_37]|uniref:Uncharacterized protein n=3 Tax=Candidatus Azamiibacteriota TaxID=1752741 RepID=A0A0G1QDM2_9BACT|nr:MAG: hypothetical protein UX51_C0047G0005 [Candidatus Azambacteria bacterium GW2011_GWF2_46_32]KKU39529.1 MAG: hypothetical protein UX53_C0004G0030 [Candidatus Azambacteria bacterium GW2011_GWB2_46_37]KKU42917.1 MAG: hypothetical protein UX56_C0002G0003 [Candidatus Azambacteria bacterium GW2011_GWD2_46_48]HAM96091.1 hypothetical protein [Candidatus Azambacteria bacterium]HAQ05654.1 hypothetical protein [Candidatus Azambacteria bacterium]